MLLYKITYLEKLDDNQKKLYGLHFLKYVTHFKAESIGDACSKATEIANEIGNWAVAGIELHVSDPKEANKYLNQATLHHHETH